jgi:hypothetical protein
MVCITDWVMLSIVAVQKDDIRLGAAQKPTSCNAWRLELVRCGAAQCCSQHLEALMSSALHWRS